MSNNTLLKGIEVAEKRKRPRKKSMPVFKDYNQTQLMLLPPNLEELIPPNHMVRVVNKTIDQLNIEPLMATYKGGGTSSYHPAMMIKVLVYAYLSKIYTSRMIAKALREDVNFMWLSGMNKPDFRSINNFRSGRMKTVIDEVFGSMVVFCVENKYVRLENYFVDGTKIEADANRYSYVWAKNTTRHKKGVQEKIKKLLRSIKEENERENDAYGDRDVEELAEDVLLSSEKIRQQVEGLNKILERQKEGKSDGESNDTKSKKRVEKVKKEIEAKQLPRLVKYEEQESILSGRNSYSKTDPDATFLRDKKDQLVPAYNILSGSENQFIVNYTIHQTASETELLPQHIKHLKETVGIKPQAIVGDSAYGSQKNYEFIEKEDIGNYLKYNTYHYEKTRKYQANIFNKDHFAYNKETDSYECPNKRKLKYKETQKRRTRTGYETEHRVYESEECKGCPLAKRCKKTQDKRSISINTQLEGYKAQARAHLESEKGKTLRKERGIEIETVFGDIKWNQGYRRFRLRGIAKVKVEYGLVSMAHNIKKIARIETKKQ